jgi:hypothetical protein
MKPTYKDALVSKVTDDSNRMGLNTFQLIHFLNSSKPGNIATENSNHEQEETQSVDSEGMDRQGNTKELKFHRVRLQFTLEDSTPDTYMEDMSNHINKLLEVINLNTPGVTLAPWHKKKGIKSQELLSTIGEDSIETKTQYLRISILHSLIITVRKTSSKK